MQKSIERIARQLDPSGWVQGIHECDQFAGNAIQKRLLTFSSKSQETIPESVITEDVVDEQQRNSIHSKLFV
jgi:hypothetical protein